MHETTDDMKAAAWKLSGQLPSNLKVSALIPSPTRLHVECPWTKHQNPVPAPICTVSQLSNNTFPTGISSSIIIIMEAV